MLNLGGLSSKAWGSTFVTLVLWGKEVVEARPHNTVGRKEVMRPATNAPELRLLLAVYTYGMFLNFLSNVVTGIFSGIVVAVALWFFSSLRKPTLELFYVGPQRAVIRNNRFRAVLLAGAWEIGNGEVFFRPDGFRGGNGSFYIPRYGEIIVGTSYFAPGQTADAAYKHVKNTRKVSKQISLEEENKVDVSQVVVSPEQFPKWKLITLSFKSGM